MVCADARRGARAREVGVVGARIDFRGGILWGLIFDAAAAAVRVGACIPKVILILIFSAA